MCNFNIVVHDSCEKKNCQLKSILQLTQPPY